MARTKHPAIRSTGHRSRAAPSTSATPKRTSARRARDGDGEGQRQRKPYRARPGTVALREKLFIPTAPFIRTVREISFSLAPSVTRWEAEALVAIQEASEDFIVHLFEDAMLCAIHARSVTVSDAYEVSDPNLSKVELGLKINKVLEGDCGHSALDKGNVSTEKVQSTSPTVCLGDTEPIIVETENFNIGETEVVDLVFEGSCKEMGGSVSEYTAKVDERVEGQNSRGYPASKNIEDLDAYTYVSSGSVDERGGSGSVDERGGRRELPNSFKEPEVNEGLWVPRQCENDKQTFNNLLDDAGVVINDDLTDSNYIKSAKEHGLTYHRPRWWPPEGFDDHVMK